MENHKSEPRSVKELQDELLKYKDLIQRTMKAIEERVPELECIKGDKALKDEGSKED